MEPRHYPHRRLNPLTGEWVLVSPHRTLRPWQGKVEPPNTEHRPPYDPACYLCPGNARAGSARNPEYRDTFAFENDFAALLPEAADFPGEAEELFRSEGEPGRCEVICFSPRHDLSLPMLSVTEIARVIQTWTERTRALFEDPAIACVQVFENKGELMGCSNPHPHSQIWATKHLANEVAKELSSQRDYRNKHGVPLLMDYLKLETARRERLVYRNEHFTALVPYWAVWPFETLVLPHRPVGTLMDLRTEEVEALADLIRQLTIRYDNLFQCSFPYSMGFHQAPKAPGAEAFQMHLHFFPPLLRSASVRKFMVGFELLGMPQRDLTPEQAAAKLREQSGVHYLASNS